MKIRLEPVGEGPVIPLDRPIVLIGRHPECDVRIDSHKISRRHCVVVQLSDGYHIRDLGSTNGVYINGQRVDQGVLTPDTEFQIGNLKYLLILKEEGDKPAREFPAASPGEDVPAKLFPEVPAEPKLGGPTAQVNGEAPPQEIAKPTNVVEGNQVRAEDQPNVPSNEVPPPRYVLQRVIGDEAHVEPPREPDFDPDAAGVFEPGFDVSQLQIPKKSLGDKVRSHLSRWWLIGKLFR